MSVASITSAGTTAAVKAIRLGGDNIKAQIGTAVLAQVQDQQEAMAQALLKMIDSAPSPGHLRRTIDVRA